MAVSAGDPITALAVNTCNASASMSGTVTSGNNVQDSIGNNGEFWSHRPSGALLVTVTKADSGMYDIFIGSLDKYVGGSWTTVEAITLMGGTTTKSVNSTGRGKYRLNGGFSGTTGTYRIYCGQTDILSGEKVILFEGFLSGGGKTGTGTQKITAALANATRIGSPKGIV